MALFYVLINSKVQNEFGSFHYNSCFDFQNFPSKLTTCSRASAAGAAAVRRTRHPPGFCSAAAPHLCCYTPPTDPNATPLDTNTGKKVCRNPDVRTMMNVNCCYGHVLISFAYQSALKPLKSDTFSVSVAGDVTQSAPQTDDGPAVLKPPTKKRKQFQKNNILIT